MLTPLCQWDMPSLPLMLKNEQFIDAKKEAAACFSFKNVLVSSEGATVLPSICSSLHETSAVWL